MIISNRVNEYGENVYTRKLNTSGKIIFSLIFIILPITAIVRNILEINNMLKTHRKNGFKSNGCFQKRFYFSLERMSTSRISGNIDPKKGEGLGVWLTVFIVLVVLFVCFGLWGTCTESGKSTFSNLKSKMNFSKSSGGGESLRNLDVIMFMNPTCPWCKKMIGVLESEGQMNNIMIVDLSKPEGVAMAQQFGADKQGAPSFISRKLKTGTVGYRDSVAKLIDALKPPVGGESNGSEDDKSAQIRSLQIVLFAREGCGYCTKAKENLAETGLTEAVQIIDITTPEGQQTAAQLLPPNSSGVPAWVSIKTKKHVIGFKPIEQIVQELQ